MGRLKITTDEFTKAKDAEFVVNVREKIEALNSNTATFPAPNPSVAELTAHYNDLMAKTVAADQGSIDQKNARELQRGVVTSMIYQLMTYVLSIAATAQTLDEQNAIIVRAKFVPSKASQQAATRIPQVQQLRLTWTGNSGEVLLKFKRIKNIRMYRVQITTDDPASATPNWQDYQLITRCKLVITGLQPLTRIWCRVIAHGPAGTSTPSDPAMSVVG